MATPASVCSQHAPSLKEGKGSHWPRTCNITLDTDLPFPGVNPVSQYRLGHVSISSRDDAFAGPIQGDRSRSAWSVSHETPRTRLDGAKSCVPYPPAAPSAQWWVGQAAALEQYRNPFLLSIFSLPPSVHFPFFSLSCSLIWLEISRL